MKILHCLGLLNSLIYVYFGGKPINIALFLCLNSLTVTKNSFKTSYICSHMNAWMLSHFSSVRVFAILWTPQAPLFVGFSRQEYWSGLPFPPSGDLPDPGVKPRSPTLSALQVDSLLLEPLGTLTIGIYMWNMQINKIIGNLIVKWAQ